MVLLLSNIQAFLIVLLFFCFCFCFVLNLLDYMESFLYFQEKVRRVLFPSQEEEALHEEKTETPGVQDVPWHPGVLKIAEVNTEIIKMAGLCQDLYSSVIRVPKKMETIIKDF